MADGKEEGASRPTPIQAIYDNPFLLLVIGIAVLVVFYTISRLLEIASIPLAREEPRHEHPHAATGVVEEGRPDGEDLDRHRARLVPRPLRDDAPLALHGQAESVLRDVPISE